MKKLKILSIFFFLIVLTVSVGSQDLIKEEKTKGIVIDSDVFSIEWNITKTGAEENLDVSYNEINRTTTEFCIKPNDKVKYESSLSLSDKDITNVPITKTDNVDVFTLEKQSFDLSIIDEKTKEPIEQCFKIHYTSSFNNLSFKIGWESVIVDASAISDATFIPSSENIVRDSNGNLHTGYIGGGSDVWYCNSSNEGVDWTCKEILAGTYDDSGIVIDSTDKMYIYYRGSEDIFAHNSTDYGVTWTSQYKLIDSVNVERPSCVVDGNNILHCCIIRNALTLYYSNTSIFPNEVAVNTNVNDDTDFCDIEIDSNNVIYIVGTGSDQDDLDLWTKSGTGWGDENRYEIDNDAGSVSSYSGVSIAIDDDDRIYIAGTFGNDLWFYNSTTSSATSSWTTQEIDTSNSFQPDIAVNSQGVVIIMSKLQPDASMQYDDSLYMMNSTDYGITWSARTLLDSDDAGMASIADTNYPSFNRMTDTAYYIYTRDTPVVVFDSFSVAYTPEEEPTDSCTYSGSGDWQIESIDLCNLTDSSETVDGTLIINGTGGRYLLDNSNLSSTGFSFQCTDCQMVFKNGAKFARLI